MAKYKSSVDCFGKPVNKGDMVMYAGVETGAKGNSLSVRDSEMVNGVVENFGSKYIRIQRINPFTMENIKGKVDYRRPNGVMSIEIVDPSQEGSAVPQAETIDEE